MTPAGMFAMAYRQFLRSLGWSGHFVGLVRYHPESSTVRAYFRGLELASSGAEWRR
jgi:hypothetical protein